MRSYWQKSEPWIEQAKCRSSATAFFYPDRGQTIQIRLAKAVCNGTDGNSVCPVRTQCLDFAIRTSEHHGIWGGCTEKERQIIRLRRRKKKERSVKLVRRKDSPLRNLLTTDNDTRILGAVQRHLFIREPEPREQRYSHPSEMAKGDWCLRAAYYRRAGFLGKPHGNDPSFTLENVFAEGHAIHKKWQSWLWEMGLLRGEWGCLSCRYAWMDTAPKRCPECASEVLRYLEVPVFDEELGIVGHADGDIADAEDEEDCPYLEIKSIGIGTLRFENPTLLLEHTHKTGDTTWIDYDGLWKSIRRPFPAHVRQANLYLHLSGRKMMVFIYECKWNQQVKEFVVRYQKSMISALLEDCKDIQWHLQKGTPPPRPASAKGEGCSFCKSCGYREECYGIPAPAKAKV